MTNNRRVMRYVTASPELARGLQELLLQLGVQSCVTSYVQRSSTVSVTGGNLTLLLERVTLVNTDRRERVPLEAIRDISDIVVLNRTKVSKIRSLMSAKYGLTHTKVRRFDRVLERGKKEGNFYKISRKSLIDLSMEFPELEAPLFIHDAVVDISYDHSVPMIDIEVDSDEHTFILGNGVVTHNCQGSEHPHIIYIHTNSMETQELVYTAITRARERLSILTPRKLLNIKRTEEERLTILRNHATGDDPMKNEPEGL